MPCNTKKRFKDTRKWCLLFLSATSIVCSTPTVKIGKGRLSGRTVEFNGSSVDEFLGVPYARPPLGKLRFKKPRPMREFEGTLEATKLPPACPQRATKEFPFWYPGPNELPKSEDCLYLNVWTPSGAALGDDGKAVFFYIHGGHYERGSSRQTDYNGLPLAALGDVIVVTTNYRVGPLGFLYSGTEAAPGNAGLWDILLALRWVNQHIEVFGGDPSRITIAGQSEGAYSVGLLSLSPLTRGLFRRQVMMSGSPAQHLDEGMGNIALAQKLASMVNCANKTYTIHEHPREVLRCLREVSAEELIEAASHLPSAFWPQFGDELIPVDPATAVANGDDCCQDLLTGIMQDEGSNLFAYKYSDIFGVRGEKEPLINRTTSEGFIRDTFQKYPDEQDGVVNHYLPPQLPDYANLYRYQAYTAYGDLNYFCPVVYYAEKCTDHKKVFFYFWRHRTSTQFAEWEGVTHFSEVPFVFGKPLLLPYSYQPDEVELSGRVVRAWTDFVKHGSPETSWPSYSRSRPKMRNLATGEFPEEEEGPHLSNCRYIGTFLGFP